MRYLIDTHTFLWIVDDDKKLSDKVKKIYLNNSNDIYLSVASIWEMAIKISRKKLHIGCQISEFIEIHVKDNNIQLLDIQPSHISPVELMPFHHNDPFDRLLIAQCLQEKMHILSKDKIFDKYNVKRIW